MKKASLVLFTLLLLAFSARAQILSSVTPEEDSLAIAKVRVRMDSIRQYRPTVALVLGGGGARGLAHLGVIRYLEELGIPVDIVTGTSMGGLIAGLYSLGYSHQQLDSLVRDIEWPVMMSDKIPNAYLSYRLRKYRERFVIRVPFHYDREDLIAKKQAELQDRSERYAEEAGTHTSDMLEESLSRVGLGMPDGFLFGINVRNTLGAVSVGYQDSISFADLPIPFACVATDIYNMTPKYWTGGRLTDALRSTMAIPLYFRAVRKDGEILLDGGMRNNYPADIARAMGADIVIGSDMSIHRGIDELNSPVDFIFQSISLLSKDATESAMSLVDFNVHHELPGYTMLSFDEKSVNDIIDQGYQNALSHKEAFEAVAARVAGKGPGREERPRHATNIALKKVKVGDIAFTGITPAEQKRILHPRMYAQDGLYGKEEVENLLNYIFGTNAFESVTYRLEGAGEPYTLVFDCQKGQVNDFAVNVHGDTDDYVSVGLHVGLGTRRLSGPRFTGDLKLGNSPSLKLDFAFKPMIGLPTIGLTARGNLLNGSYRFYSGEANDHLLGLGLDAYLEDSRMTYGSMRAGLSFEMNPYEHFLSVDREWMGWDWKSYCLSAFGKITIETYDDGYFPTRGFRFLLDGRYNFKGYRVSFQDEGPVPGYFAAIAHVGGAFSIGEHFTILPTLYAGWNSIQPNEINPFHVVAVGGTRAGRYIEHQMPFFGYAAGFTVCERVSGTAQLDLRYRFARKNYITVRGGVYTDHENLRYIFEDGYRTWAFGAEYARQTIVGPFRLGAQWCQDRGFSVSASIGMDF